MTSTLTRLVEEIGPTAARRLCDRYGGTHLFVPKSIEADHWLARLLGLPAAQRLARDFGPGRIYLPRWPTPDTRIEAVARLTAEGCSAPEIARRLDICDRTVHRLRAKARA